MCSLADDTCFSIKPDTNSRIDRAGLLPASIVSIYQYLRLLKYLTKHPYEAFLQQTIIVPTVSDSIGLS